MNHRTLRYAAGWEWHMLQIERSQPDWSKRGTAGFRDAVAVRSTEAKQTSLAAIKKQFPACSSWLDDCMSRHENQIVVSELPGGEPLLHGTLMFQVTDNDLDVQPFHYWVTEKLLLTVQTDLRLSIRLQRQPWDDKLERCTNAPEALTIFLNALMEAFHTGLDQFEKGMGQLEDSMRLRNRTAVMNSIFERRYELLHWNHLFIPVREIESGIKEAFLGSVAEREGYIRLHYKLERIEQLLGRYSGELDTLLSMDDIISSSRSAGTLKTLILLFALLTPAAAAGVLWRMNAKEIPWIALPMGFAFLSGIVILFTLAIYLWLWRSVWSGGQRYGMKSKQAAALVSTNTSALSPDSKANSAAGSPTGEPTPPRSRRKK